jgi:membrane-associated protease RseP (regulator of RpoE activity)
MKAFKWLCFGVAMASSVCLLPVKPVAADEEAGEKENKRRVIVIEEEPGDDVVIRRQSAQRYMLGIRCEQDDAGVFVADVIEGMPAEKVGVKPQDRITKVGDAEIKNVESLVDAVQKSEGKSIDLTIKRGDEELLLSVKPVQREVTEPGRIFRDGEEFFRGFPQFQEDRLFRFHPGFVFGDKLGEFPKNVTITITRENDEPAKITIEREGEKWTVDEKSIDKLPEDLRAWARRMLTAANADSGIPDIERLPELLVPPRARRFFPDEAMRPRTETDEDLKELKEEVQKLREMVEKLQKE